MPRSNLIRLLLLAGLLLVLPASAIAKDFRPGDVRLCNNKRCIALKDPAVLAALARFYYSGPQPGVARPARLRSPSYELRFRNGYPTGLVAGVHLDRFLSFGVNEGRFSGGTWYEAPPAATAAILKLRAALKPTRLTRSEIARSQ